MPPQLKRLIPLFIAFIGLFLLIRHFLVPDTFGQYGHYRGAALDVMASKELVFATKTTCFDCHDDIQGILESDMHAGLSCLICHGPATEHVEDPFEGEIRKEGDREFCARCHDINAARPLDVVTQVDVSEHNVEFENCTDCHNPHAVWEGLK